MKLGSSAIIILLANIPSGICIATAAYMAINSYAGWGLLISTEAIFNPRSSTNDFSSPAARVASCSFVEARR